MTIPAPSTSRLDRILLTLGVMSEKLNLLTEDRAELKKLEERVRFLEASHQVLDSKVAGSNATWRFMWDAINTAAISVLTFLTVYHSK